jgi:hypothetical protein
MCSPSEVGGAGPPEELGDDADVLGSRWKPLAHPRVNQLDLVAAERRRRDPKNGLVRATSSRPIVALDLPRPQDPTGWDPPAGAAAAREFLRV